MPFSYKTGGTLSLEDSSYIVRQCDTELYEALKRQEFCYVLTSRQMGKSSLMVRTAKRLKEENIRVVMLDLTTIGTGEGVTLSQWYNGLLLGLSEQLMMEDELEEAYADFSSLGEMQRWFSVIKQVVLPGCPHGLVIFIDEIDVVRTLKFSTDDFFAGMRACYTQRSQEPILQTLTFCLLGVASPSDLITDSRMTPFNIGQRIVLEDFTAVEAQPLTQGLVHKDLLKRILSWTHGHPYLTQALCEKVVTDHINTSRGVDQCCKDLFLSSRSRDNDKNLSFVTKTVLRYEDPQYDRVPILETYRKIYQSGSPVQDDETNPYLNQLLLAGLIKIVRNTLHVRNRIYAQAFNQRWIEQNMPDAELRRQQAAFRRGAMRASLYATGVIIVLVSGGTWVWDSYLREVKTYYPNFIKKYGVPIGQGTELTWTQAQQRAVFYKLWQKGRKNPVYRVDAVRRQTVSLTSQNTKENIHEMDRGPLQIVSLTNFNTKENTNKVNVVPLQIAPPINLNTEENTDEFALRHDVGTYFQTNSRYGKVAQEVRWEFVLDKEGEVVREKAYDRKGKFIWGMLYSPRTSDQQVSVQYVDEKGFPRPQTNTQAEFVELKYSPEGYEIEARYFDRQHRPQFGPDGYHQVMKKYDEGGYVVEESYFDTEGKTILSEKDYHKRTAKYDERGNQIEETYFDVEGKPTLYKDGYHKVTAKYDERGNQIEWAYFDIKGKPTLHKDGNHKATGKYDERGNQIEWAYFDVEGKPTLHKDGYHKEMDKYDERDNQIEWTYFDVEGKSILNKDGYHKVTGKYDERGNQIEWAYFDVEGKPMSDEDGFHKITGKYDERGNRIEWAYFDVEGKPMLHKDGYHKATGKYDERGNKIEGAYFDIEGKPTLYEDSFHKATGKYDERGNRIEWAYFDVEGKPMLCKDGFHKVMVKYDEHGNRTEEAFFDVEGRPMLNKNGYHKITDKYDEHNNRIEWTFFDVEGKPMLYKDGYHKMTGKYDERGNQIESTYFDVEGKPMLHKNGYHKMTGKYDERGNQIEWACFDVEGKPTLSKDGFHRVTSKYDEYNNRIEKTFFDVNGQLIRREE